jgi:hypothetical protein
MTFRDVLRAELARVNRGLQDCEVLESRGHDVSNLAAARSELRARVEALLVLGDAVRIGPVGRPASRADQNLIRCALNRS